MNKFKKIPVFTFYYILPTFLGFSAGLIYRDLVTLDVNKKVTMSLADYYLLTDERPAENSVISREFPDLNRLIKKGAQK
jgi:hypothetical protein